MIIVETARHKLRSVITWLHQKVRHLFVASQWGVRLSIGASICMAVLSVVFWIISSIHSFIDPASRASRTVYFGSATSYCTYWATNHEQVGRPTAGPCGVMLIGVDLSPANTMPFTNDAYEAGNCTYWAALRRGQTSRAIPNTWGDAYMWAERAAENGYTVDHVPTAGAIMQTSGGSLGHVAYVERVDADGTWHISEMNVIGLGEVDYRAMPLSAAADYYFIH